MGGFISPRKPFKKARIEYIDLYLGGNRNVLPRHLLPEKSGHPGVLQGQRYELVQVIGECSDRIFFLLLSLNWRIWPADHLKWLYLQTFSCFKCLKIRLNVNYTPSVLKMTHMVGYIYNHWTAWKPWSDSHQDQDPCQTAHMYECIQVLHCFEFYWPFDFFKALVYSWA